MNDVTRILSAIEQGDPRGRRAAPAAGLRRAAPARRRRGWPQEKPGQTLQATALVHEAYLRLVGAEQARRWNGRGHFFAAAAEAMRRILVEQRPPQAAPRSTAAAGERVGPRRRRRRGRRRPPTTSSPSTRP